MARQLTSSVEVGSVVLCDRTPSRAEEIAKAVGASAAVFEDVVGAVDVVIVGRRPVGFQTFGRIEATVAAGVPVISVADGVDEVDALLGITTTTTLVIGAGMCPGLSDVLARQAARDFDSVEEIHVAKIGTAGPACALQHHRALGAEGDRLEGRGMEPALGWVRRELCWFPDPLGARDCYRAGLPDALLLAPAFPGVQRVTGRIAATRRDRLTSALPMLRRPHPEGELGAVRVEVRAARGSERGDRARVPIDRPGIAAGAVAAVAVPSGPWSGRFRRTGVGGLADLVDDPGSVPGRVGAAGRAGRRQVRGQPTRVR